MLFHKKQAKGDVPINEISEMTRKGMSDKDIIKNLKGRGYSYNDIEKAMLSAVKTGVSDENAPRMHDDDFGSQLGKRQHQETFDNLANDELFAGTEPQYEELPEV